MTPLTPNQKPVMKSGKKNQKINEMDCQAQNWDLNRNIDKKE
jgi:hypothetical protein